MFTNLSFNQTQPTSLRLIFISLFIFFGLTMQSSAQEAPKIQIDSKAQSIAAAVPAQIPEMITGGKWRKGNIGGFYRAMVILPDEKVKAKKNSIAAVVIQWIGKEDGSERSKVFKTVNLPEVSHKKLQYAYLSMDTMKDNEMTLLVSSFDTKKKKDIAISFKATLPGQYQSK